MSKIFKDMGKESLLKRVQSATKGGVSKKVLDSIVRDFQNSEEFPHDMKEFFNELVEIGKKEEETGGFVPESIGDYAAVIRAVNGSMDPKTKGQKFLLDVEEKSKWALELASKKNYSEAGKAILDEKFFAPFLWDGIRNKLDTVETYEDFLLLRVSILAEIFLASMIIREFEYETKTNCSDTHSFLDIWPLSGPVTKNPFGRLFDWIKRQANVQTIPEFFNHPSLVEVEMDQLRLKRWSNGSHQPRREWLEEISKHLWGDSYHLPFSVRIGIAKYSNFIGYTIETIRSSMIATKSLDTLAYAYPWPGYPHDNIDFASWGRSRYSFWRDYARDYDLISV